MKVESFLLTSHLSNAFLTQKKNVIGALSDDVHHFKTCHLTTQVRDTSRLPNQQRNPYIQSDVQIPGAETLRIP